MPTDNAGNELAEGDVVLLAGTIRRIEASDVLVVLGSAGTLAVRATPGDLLDVSKVVTTDGARVIPATAVQLSGDGWSGALAGSGVTNLQELTDWLDANLTPP